MKITYKIDQQWANNTVETVLRKSLGISRKILIKLKKNDGITLMGETVFTNHIVQENDVLELQLPEEASAHIMPENIPLDVAYEDESYLIINKPCGMAVHPTLNHTQHTLANGVMHLYANSFVFRPVNRLDKDTSGLVIIGKNQLAAKLLSEQFQQVKVQKNYYAICCNHPVPSAGEIELPIARAPDSIIKRITDPSGSYARTEYETVCISPCKTHSLVKLMPHTGRTHQLRVHMASLGCPLYADFLYGAEVMHETFYLHCAALTFVHPIKKEPCTIRAALPLAFSQRLEAFRL